MKDLLYVGNRLSRHGLTATGIEILGPFLEREGFRIRYASSRKNKLARLADMLWQVVSHRRVDYVLIDTYSTWNFWYAWAVSQLCRLFKMRYIPILHGGNLPQRLKRNPALCKMIFAHSAANVAPSGYLYQAFSEAGFAVIKIPNPSDAAEFRYLQRNSLAPKLLWVRSFANLYNPEMAIRVVSHLSKRYPDALLCMVGPDKDGMLEKLRQQAKAQSVSVTFTGRLGKSDWAAKASDYDIFINTARTDNTPFSIIEALSLGLVVVSTNVGGIPHLLEHKKTAMLVANDDAQGMAEAVVELIENPTLQTAILENSRALAAACDWRNVRAKWLEILV